MPPSHVASMPKLSEPSHHAVTPVGYPHTTTSTLARTHQSSGSPLVCLKRDNEPSVLISLYGRGVEVWKVPDAVGLVEFLAERIPTEDRKWLFFTEERSLEEISAAKCHPWLATATWYPGDQCCLREILDRFLFYDLIAAKGFGAVPRTVSAEYDPLSEFGDEFFFRYRLTWLRGKKMPRPLLVNGPIPPPSDLNFVKRICYQNLTSPETTSVSQTKSALFATQSHSPKHNGMFSLVSSEPMADTCETSMQADSAFRNDSPRQSTGRYFYHNPPFERTAGKTRPSSLRATWACPKTSPMVIPRYC